jgi:transposase
VTNQTTQNASHEIIPVEIEENLLAPYWSQVREKLFPLLEVEGFPPLTDKLKTLAQILEIVRIEEFVAAPEERKRGGQQIDRRPIARAFLAKAYLNLSQTRALKEQLHQSESLRRLCGMEKVPSEPTFSRAFAEFARQNLGELAHLALVEKFVSPEVVMHVSHDSTAVEVREKAQRKEKVPRVKKSGVVPRKEKNERLPSQPGYRGKSIYQ